MRVCGLRTLVILLLPHLGFWAQAEILRPIRTFGLGELRSFAAGPEGTMLVSAGPSGAFVWDQGTASFTRTVDGNAAPVTAVAVSQDGRHYLTADIDITLRSASGEPATPFSRFTGHTRPVADLAFSPDAKRFASASEDNTVRVWSVESGGELNRFTVPGALQTTVLFTPDGGHLISADTSLTNNVRLWNLAAGVQVRTFGRHLGQAPALALVSSNLLATAGDDRVVRVWNWDTGELVRELTAAPERIHSLVVPTAQDRILAGCASGLVLAWASTSGDSLPGVTLDPHFRLRQGNRPGRVWAAQADGLVQEWDLSTRKPVQTLEGHLAGTLTDVAFSPDGNRILAGGVEKWTRIWDRTNAVLVAKLAGHSGGTSTARYSPDGRRLVTTEGFPRPVARIWNATNGQPERELVGHTGWLLGAEFSPDGSKVVTGGLDSTVRLWDANTGAPLRTWSGHASWVHCVAFSPDGRWVASGSSDSTAGVWSSESSDPVRGFELDAGTVKSVAFSPSGTRLAVAWEGGVVRIHEWDTGNLKLEIVTGSGFLNDIAFSPDGRYLVTAEGWPTFVSRVWDARTGEPLRILFGHTAPVTAVAFNARGTAIVTASDTVRLWDVSDLAGRLTPGVDAGRHQLEWSVGELQHAPTAAGPWKTMDGARSPWTVPQEASLEFFRTFIPENP